MEKESSLDINHYIYGQLIFFPPKYPVNGGMEKKKKKMDKIFKTLYWAEFLHIEE